MIYSSLEYSIPYVIVLLLLFFCSILEQKNIKGFVSKKTLRNFSFLIVLIFFGLRGFVASDWISYFQFFSDVPPIGNELLGYFKIVSFEPGFVIFSSIIKTFSDNYFFYQFINILVDLILLRILLKKYCTNYFIFGLAVYFAFCSEYEINMFRNVKAIMLFLISIKYIKSRNALAFFGINIAGLMFHNSAIFYFPLYFFIHKNIKKTYLIISIVGLVIYFFQIHYIGAITSVIGDTLGGMFKEKNDFYLKGEDSGVTLGIFYTIIPLFLAFKYYDKILAYRSENIIFINLLFLYCFSTLYLSEILVFRGRFAALFAFSLSVILPLFYLLQRNLFHRKVFVNLLLVVVVSKIALTNTPILNRYDNLIFGISSYDDRMKEWIAFYHNVNN
ncbi:MAG: EpsG family protein [Cloacibacterium sp.]|uniref:EpsG family protein n=1 Tax=Cloacibacterium sp. TaxID=1913682 RepID=UPI003C723819